MMKKVAVQKELTDIKYELSNLGYDVSDIEEGENVEAIVYLADGYNIPYDNQMVNMTEGDSMDNNQSAILINATGKSSYDINNIIKNRIYSPLFE